MTETSNDDGPSTDELLENDDQKTIKNNDPSEIFSSIDAPVSIDQTESQDKEFSETETVEITVTEPETAAFFPPETDIPTLNTASENEPAQHNIFENSTAQNLFQETFASNTASFDNSSTAHKKPNDVFFSSLNSFHEFYSPQTEAEVIAQNAILNKSAVWVSPENVSDNSSEYENSLIRPHFCHQILHPIFQRRLENQDITSIYEWTNLHNPFTPRELELIDITMALDKSIPFADQMRPNSENPQTHIRAEFLKHLIEKAGQATNTDQITNSPLLSPTDPTSVLLSHTKEIYISGATITGQLDLSYQNVKLPLHLTYCQFDAPIKLNQSTLADLTLRGSHCPGLSANGSTINGATTLTDGFAAIGTVEFIGSILRGPFNASGGSFVSSGTSINMSALSLQLTHVKNNIYLGEKFNADGMVNLQGTKCDLDLTCHGHIVNQQQDKSGCALLCDNSKINGNVKLGETFSAIGGVWFRGTTIGGNLETIGASFHNFSPKGKSDALIIQNSHISNKAIFLYANIVGRLTIQNSQINSDCNLSFIACSNKTSDGNGKVLNINQSNIGGSIALAESTFKGKVSILETSIANKLDCTFTIIENVTVEQFGEALRVENTTIGHDFNLAYGFSAKGHVRADHVKIGGNLICNGGHFHGELELSNCKINHELSFDKANDPEAKFENIITLKDTHTESLADLSRSWPEQIIQSNFTYKKFAPDAPYSAIQRTKWLELNPQFAPMAYQQTIKALNYMGHKHHAKTLSIELANKSYWQSIALKPEFNAVSVKPKPPSPLQKLYHLSFMPIYVIWWLFHGKWLGFGYKSSRLFITTFVLLALATLLNITAEQKSLFIPKSTDITLSALYNKCNPDMGGSWTRCNIIEVPDFSPALYALDTMLPILDLDQYSNWRALKRDYIQEVPTPTCLQLNKACLNVKWLPINMGPSTLRYAILGQLAFGWLGLFSLIYLIVSSINRKNTP